MKNLENKKVAILATDGFEQSELMQPKQRLEEAGAQVHIISLKSGQIKGWDDGNWGKSVDVDKTLEEASSKDYNALVLPGGVINPDTLRQEDQAVSFVREFFEQKKPVAAICHGPQLLIEADVLQDRKVTSFSSIRTDLKNAGAQWMDQEVVTDQGLVTSRKPADLPAFCDKVIEEIAEGKHEEQDQSL
jgi:protease I